MTELPILIEPEALLNQLDQENVRLVDLCNAENYAAAHLPNAVHIAYTNIISAQPPVGGLLPDAAQFANLMSLVGISPDTHVVAYDDEGGGRAARLIWTLHVFGHEKASLLNGGLHAWKAMDGPFTTEIPNIEASQFRPDYQEKYVADKSFILANLNKADFTWLDSRSPGEYAGTTVRANRGGHIPGAINYEWTEAMDIQNHLKLRPATEISTILASRGLRQDQESYDLLSNAPSLRFYLVCITLAGL